MNPVTRYVKEVEKNLSGFGRLRISAMIYKDLSRQVDALEAKLGREPTDGEMTALLAEFGPAAEVAARYTGMAARTPSHDLLERYLAAVERRLPKEQAADIVAELREALEARIDAKPGGQAASSDEVAAILKEFGHPTLVAARYQTQQYLIGPGLYPWFWPAQRMALGIALAVLVVLTVIRVLDSSRPLSAFIGRVFAWWEPLAMVFGLVTLVFMLMEQAKTPVKLAERWNPRTLPHDNVRSPKPLFDSVFALGFDVVFILWWIGVITVPGRKEASVQFDFTGVWDSVHTPILALALVTAAVHAADIVYPAWSRLRSAVSIAGHVGGLAVMAVLLQADKLITVTDLPNGDARAAQLSWWLDGPFRVVLVLVAVGWAIGLGVEIWRQVRAGHPAGPARGAPPAASAIV